MNGQKSWQELISYYDEKKISTRRKIVSYGPTKVGKSRFGSTIPGDICIIDTDHSLAGLIDKHVPVLTISRDDVINSRIKVYDTIYAFIRALRDKEEPFKTTFPNIKTLMIDGVTSMADLFLDEVMLDQRIGKERRDPLYQKATFDEYGAISSRLETIFTIIDDLDINIYVTAGLKMDKDETSGLIVSMPDIVGSFRQKIGHRFDAVLYFHVEKGKYYATCTSNSSYKFPCGIRGWIGPDEIENPTFDRIFDPKNFGERP